MLGDLKMFFFFLRCTALNALGVFIVEELIHCQGHPRVHDCICVLLASITVSIDVGATLSNVTAHVTYMAWEVTILRCFMLELVTSITCKFHQINWNLILSVVFAPLICVFPAENCSNLMRIDEAKIIVIFLAL